MRKQRHDVLKPGRFVFSGYLGNKIDTLAQARLLGPGAWDRIYPETEQAFRERVDDTLEPGKGLWQGEFWGKHILAAVAAMRYYNIETLRPALLEAARNLIATQDADGYIGTYAESAFLGGNTWNLWCRKYTLWGLVELWRVLGEESILEAAGKLLDHIMHQVGPEGTPIIRTGNFFGLPSSSILQPVVEMYRATGREDYLNFALYIVEQWGQHPEGIPDLLRLGLENGPIHKWFRKPFRWAKGYEFLSCVEGLLELYRVTGNEQYLQAVLNIHGQLLDWEQSFIGSISFDDKLLGARYFKNTFSEICDNIYWNRLNHSLYRLTGEARFAELFESTLYNSLLPGMKPDGSWGLRRQRVSHEHIPATPHCYLKHHQCCTTNLPRGLFQAGETAVSTDADGLRLALYAAGQGQVQLKDGRSVSIEIEGDYPFDGRLKLKIKTSDGKPCALRLRKPAWSDKVFLRCGDRELDASEKAGWIEIEPSWVSGAAIEAELGPMLRREEFDPTLGGHDEETIAWQRKHWAEKGYLSEDGKAQHSTLIEKDARDQTAAIAFFLGPLALARDIRLGDTDIFSSIPWDAEPGDQDRQEIVDPPEGIERAWAIDIREGETLSLCDYPSAGNTWDPTSRFAVWIDAE